MATKEQNLESMSMLNQISTNPSTPKNIRNRKIIFWEDQGFLQYSIAFWLQKKLDYKMYAIVDTTDRTKTFFQNQKQINFQKIWFLHDNILKNKKPDLNYLKSIEKKYNLNIWQIAANERIFYGFYNFHEFTEDEVLSIIEQECKLYEKILDELKPDFVSITTNTHQNHLFLKLCQAKRIRILFLTGSRVAGRAMISHDMDTFPEPLDTTPMTKELSFTELQNIQKKINLFNETKDYVEGFSDSKIDLIKAATQYLFFSDNNTAKTNYNYFGRTKSKVLIDSISNKVKIQNRTKFIEKNFTKKIHYDNFIFFPLQLEPERTLLIDAPFFTNQLEIIRNISKSLPIGYKLLVKEHAAMITRSWRDINWYEELMKIPNVILVHPSVTPDEILSKCSLVITITGTAGLDAAYYNKPSIVFSDVLYSRLSSVILIKNISELPSTIRIALNKQVDLHELNNFLNLIEKNSFEFKWNTFASSTHKFLFYKGNLLDVDISDTQVKSFLEANENTLLPLINEYIKRINQYNELDCN